MRTTNDNSVELLIRRFQKLSDRRKRRHKRCQNIARFFFGEFSSGVSRIVFLRKNNVYKVARFNRNLMSFLFGWQNNLAEFGYWKCGSYRVRKLLCPTTKKYFLGIIIKMPRCKTPVNSAELKQWIEENGNELAYVCTSDEQHYQNFGYLNGEIVCFDYVG